tara:strand:+ start:1920 stop:2198 length:279 start_codon:yes stop_codon:yes gene_type:complete
MKDFRESSPKAGILVYIPSQVRLVQYGKVKAKQGLDPRYVKRHTTLTEPIVAPIVETAADEVKIHYDGDNWWTSKADTYFVESDKSLGGSLA